VGSEPCHAACASCRSSDRHLGQGVPPTQRGTITRAFRCPGRAKRRRSRRTSWVVGYCCGSSAFRSQLLS